MRVAQRRNNLFPKTIQCYAPSKDQEKDTVSQIETSKKAWLLKESTIFYLKKAVLDFFVVFIRVYTIDFQSDKIIKGLFAVVAWFRKKQQFETSIKSSFLNVYSLYRALSLYRPQPRTGRLIPMIFRLSMLKARQITGHINTHQASGSSRTVASRRPQLATSGGRPMPKNDSVLSRPSSPAMLRGSAARSGCKVCGKAWRSQT